MCNIINITNEIDNSFVATESETEVLNCQKISNNYFFDNFFKSDNATRFK